jgi:hypothetical protein
MPTGPKIDPFKPQQPRIPGVPDKAPATEACAPRTAGNLAAKASPGSAAQAHSASWPNSVRIGLAAAVVVAIIGVAWWVRVSSAKPFEGRNISTVGTAERTPVRRVKALPVGPGQIATALELQGAWSARRFMFRNPVTSEMGPALAVRLPDGALWGISLREPYGRCELEYETNLRTLRSQYGLQATHPMVTNPCSGTVFDLSRYASGPNGLVRGQVVRGTAQRPPVAIEIKQHGNSIFAVRMEQTQ